MQTQYLRPKQAAAFLGVKVNTVWRWLRERPDFPRSTKLGPMVTVWDSSELQDWVDRQKEAGNATS